MIIYLHGFNSSPASSKAALLVEHCKSNSVECVAPQLADRPAQAVSLVQELCLQAGGRALVVGSSLGGYYATWLIERNPGLHGALINPAVGAAFLLAAEVGRTQKNYHNETEYRFTADHLRELEELHVPKIADPSRYLLLVQKGDEVLDYKVAAEYFAGCEQIVEEGGDHSFTGFARHLGRLCALHAETVAGSKTSTA